MKPFITALLLMSASASNASAATTPQVAMRDARISWPGAGSHFFWEIAPSPTNPDRVVACSLRQYPQEAYSIQALIYGSTDGGDTWRLLKTTDGFPTNSETSCAVSGDDTIYFSMALWGPTAAPVGHGMGMLYLWRSPDFGKTWRQNTHVGYSDADMILVKKNSAGRDRVYDFADSNGESEDRYLTIFDNDATMVKKIASWNPAPAKPGDPRHCGRKPAQSKGTFEVAALPARPGACINGTGILRPLDLGSGLLGAAYVDWAFGKPPVQHLTFTRVTDDGKPLGTPSVITLLSGHVNQMTSLADPFARYSSPAAAFGSLPNSNAGRIYVSWQDIWGGRPRVLLATSNDRGITWSSAQPVDDTSARKTGNAIPMPSESSLAVNKNGVVAVSWMESYGRCWRIAFSHDGGVHFGASLPINPCDTSRNLSLADALSGHIYPLSLGGAGFDAYGGAQANVSISDFRRQYEWLLRGTSLAPGADGSFYALWSAMGTPHDEIHATRIWPDGTVATAGTVAARRYEQSKHALCCLKTGQRGALEFYYTSYDYDPATNEIELGATIFRKRQFGGNWPLVVRFRGVKTSSLGGLRAANADNGAQGDGAEWVFDGPGESLPVGSAAGDFALLPKGQYEFSRPRMMRFRLQTNMQNYLWLRPPSSPKTSPSGANSELIDLKFDFLKGAQ